MNDTIWYYVDLAGQRHGPVTAAGVADAWRAGQADDASLAWHDGLPDWRPLGEFRDLLGLAGEPPAAVSPPIPPAGAPPSAAGPVTSSPATATAPAARSGRGCLVAALIGAAVFALVIVSIFAAIALPAYQDYVERAKAQTADSADPDATGVGPEREDPAGYGPADDGSGDPLVLAALAEARALQPAVDAFVLNTDRCPRDGTEVGMPPVALAGVVGLTVGEARTGMCTITVEFGGEGAQALVGERIVLSRDVAGDWYCTSELADRDRLPPACR